VLATGGGAVLNPDTRAAIASKGISVWLNAELEVLLRRIHKRRNARPLLQNGDPAETLQRLMAERAPLYAQADVTVQSRDIAHETIVAEILTALAGRLGVALPVAADGAASGRAAGEPSQ
jgi:shikimate kinase